MSVNATAHDTATRTTDRPAPVPLLPDSLTWGYFGSHLFQLVLPQAFILQVAHPVINSAVTVDKKYLHDPWGRARGSLELLWPVVYARPQTAIAMGQKLRELHRQIKGTDARGNRYHALDPEAYSWVHLTGFYAIVRMFELFGQPLDARQRSDYFSEWQQMGDLLGIAERCIPATEADYWREFNRIIDERIDADNEALQDLLDKDHFAKWPVHPSLSGKVPRWLWRVMMTLPSRLAHVIVKATLPENARRKLGLRYGFLDRIVFRSFATLVRVVDPLLPERWRYIGLARAALTDARENPQAYTLPADVPA